MHIESVRAAVLAEVISRVESDHTPYRYPYLDRPVSERGRYQAPKDKAHWDDMLAELRKALPGLQDLSFQTVLSAQEKDRPRRVIDALADATPVARLAHKLSEVFGVENKTPWPVDRVVNAKYLEVPPGPDLPPLSAHTMPQFVDALAERARREQELLGPVRLLAKQSLAYLESRRLGRLLAEAALSYGVATPGDAMTKLARTWSTPNWALASILAAEVVVAASESGDLFYADGLAAETVLGLRGNASGALPSPAGSGALLTESGATMVWREEAGRLDVVSTDDCRRRLRGGPLNRALWSVVSIDADSGVVDSYGRTRGLEVLARLSMMLGNSPISRGRAARAERGGSVERPVTVVRYTARSSSGPTPTTGTCAGRDLDALKWRVRGHYRRQWYPSTGEHRLIWIDEHFAERGEDGELLERPVVTKLSQER